MTHGLPFVWAERQLRQPIMEALWQGDVESRASAWKAAAQIVLS